MSDDELELLRFPIGRFHPKPHATAAERHALLDQLAGLPAQVRAATSGLASDQLEQPYRPGGWTVRQVVHHLADSHMNACIRFRRAVTEEEPTISTYDEVAWALLPDAETGDLEPSLLILDGLHGRWAAMLRALPADALGRAYLHPDMGRVSLDTALQLYVWHGRHHLAHIIAALAGMRRLHVL